MRVSEIGLRARLYSGTGVRVPCADGRHNATPRFFSTPKNELVRHHTFQSREEAPVAIFDYIEIFYSRPLLHQALGYLAPAECERRRCLLIHCPPKPGYLTKPPEPALAPKRLHARRKYLPAVLKQSCCHGQYQ
jgi:hypothetical protein